MGSKIFLFVLHGSKKIVKNFQAKIQSATWSKYILKNTKNSKKSENSKDPEIIYCVLENEGFIRISLEMLTFY